MNNPPGNRAVFGFAVHNNGLPRGDLQTILPVDLLVDSRVEPDLSRSWQVLLTAVSKSDDQELAGMSEMLNHQLKRLPPSPDTGRAVHDFHRAIQSSDQNALTFIHGVMEHALPSS